MSVLFGVHMLCPDCGGSGRDRKMNDAERRERTRLLRIAKRRDDPVPPIIRPTCGHCHGAGYVERPKGT